MSRSTIIATSPSPGNWRDTLLTAVAPMIWGSTYIVTTELLPPDRPFTAALIRCLPAGLALVLLARRLPQRQQWLRVITLGALNIGFFQALLFLAAYRLPGGLAAVLGSIQPLLVMGLAWAVDQRRPGYLAVCSALLGVVGMAALLLSADAAWDPLGILAALGGAVCMASGTFLARRWQVQMPILALTGWQLLVGSAMLAPVALIMDPPLPTLGVTQILAYAYLSIAGAVFAYALWFRGIARMSPVAAASLGLLSPLVAVVLGWVVLGQSMAPLPTLGLVMVLVSVLAVQKTSMPSRAAPAPTPDSRLSPSPATLHNGNRP